MGGFEGETPIWQAGRLPHYYLKDQCRLGLASREQSQAGRGGDSDLRRKMKLGQTVQDF